MKPVKIKQKDYDKWARYPQIKVLMDQWIAAGLLIIRDAPEPPAPAPDPVPAPPPVTGYVWDAASLCIAGMDRDWHKHDPAKVAAQAHSCGCNAVSVEMVADDTFAKGNSEAARKPYLALLDACRKRKLVLFVSVVNDWIKPEWWKNMPTLLDIVLKGGPEGVIVQPVAETRTSKGKAFEKDAVAKLKAAKFKTCNNAGARPSGKAGMDYFAWHSGGANANSTAPKGSIEVTDHSDKIMHVGYFDAKKAEALAKSAKARGCGFGLYRYVGMGGSNGSPASLPVEASADAWRAMANVYRAKEPVVIPPGKLADAIDISGVAEASTGNHMDEQRVPITHELRGLKRSGNRITFVNDLPASWFGPNHASKVTDLARAYCYWQQDGRTYGGHYDWCRPTTTSRELNNVFGAYFKIRPPKNALLYFSFVSSDGKARTQVVKG